MTTGNCIANHDQPRLALTGLRVCIAHQRRTAEAISLMPNLYVMLSQYLIGGPSAAAGEFVRSTPTPGLNLNPKVLAARTALLNHLHCWARIGMDEGPWHSCPADEPKSISVWIVTRLDWYLTQNWADEFVRESIDLQRTAENLRQPSTIKRFEVGSCPEPDCQGTLISEIRATDSLLPSLIWCDIAPIDEETGKQIHIWTPDKWHTMGRKVHKIEEQSA